MTNAHDPVLQTEMNQELARHMARIDGMLASARLRDRLIDRRTVLRTGVSAGVVAGMLQAFGERRARACDKKFSTTVAKVPSPYGDPVPTVDGSTGLPLIGLPPGFRYWSTGWAGDPIFPGQASPVTPALHDGMGVVFQHASLVVLCRNHEVTAGPAYVAGDLQYSPDAGGGNTNLIFDTKKAQWLDVWPSLSGTVRNCAGGVTPHDSWLSCEETGVVTAGTFTHGWVFEVPAHGTSDAVPIKAMGRRSHEAAAVDRQTGIVYLTEDATPGGLYRFIPNEHREYVGNYHRGGRLEILKVVGVPNANLRGANPQGGGGAPYPVPVGQPLDIEWVPIDDPENLGGNSNYAQGAALGAADFRRPEGASYSDHTIYFVCTDGGQNGNGQVFALDTRRQTLTLLYDAPSALELDNPDNMTVTPRGGLLFCEDNSGSPEYVEDGFSTERLVGLTRDGEIFNFATNLINFSGVGAGAMAPYTRPNNALSFNGQWRGQEWAGVTFDKKGDWLFVNIQTPGITFAITGPWGNGPL